MITSLIPACVILRVEHLISLVVTTFFSTYGLNYTKLCDQVRGYQYGLPFAFICYSENNKCFEAMDLQGVTSCPQNKT